jgi:Domain of unknown function (DUF4167)
MSLQRCRLIRPFLQRSPNAWIAGGNLGKVGALQGSIQNKWNEFIRTGSLMNNNRQTSRRRGRGNNNRVPSNNNRNGFDNANRIDNRARGNASQMLEKYKKLAQDAQQNGDRVNAEYYLQFADHYFRVLADFRGRQEEGRPQREWRGEDREAGEDWRDDERDGPEDSEDAETVADTGNAEDNYRRPQQQDRPERNARPERNDRPQRNERPERPERSERNERPQRNDRNVRVERPERPDRDDRPAISRAPAAQNRRDRYEHRDERPVFEDTKLDLSILPPSIAIANEPEAVAKEKPVRKPRARRPKSENEEDVVTAAE